MWNLDKKTLTLLLLCICFTAFYFSMNNGFPLVIIKNENLNSSNHIIKYISNSFVHKENDPSYHNLTSTIMNSTIFKAEKSNTKPKFNIQKVPDSKCTSPFITVDDSGRLGNQVCQFMAVYYFRLKYGIRVAVSTKMKNYLRSIFTSIPAQHLPHPCFKFNEKSTLKVGFGDMKEIFKLYHLNDQQSKNITKGSSNKINELTYYNHIRNYPCPIKELKEYRTYLRKELLFRNNLRDAAKSRLEKLLNYRQLSLSNTTIVSVHVRRKDYLNYGKQRNLVFPTKSFYLQAFNFFRKKCRNVIFFIISDDMAWIKENLLTSDSIFPGNADINSPELDYTILSLCDHHIVGMGTFGRTSAFLGKGSIIFFNSKFNGTQPQTPESFNCSSSELFFYMKNE